MESDAKMKAEIEEKDSSTSKKKKIQIDKVNNID